MIDPTADPLIVALQITITGLSIVFIVLAIVALMLSALSVSQRLLQPKEAALDQPVSPPASQPVAADQLDPHLIAILTAAAVAALDRPVRVLRVRYYRQPPLVWARLGRVSVMAARQLRR
ncbi:OadG family protein [Chloroflexus sp.]|uniref:OadG family protein n=1 Tax=Chloroflexus sp. TaxID=1904827 RepID=UPI00261B68CD|nr:OadG family protein [uncultured Chloroflexus sp.]